MAGRDRTPAAWLGLARDHAGNDSRAPRLSVWHGSEDSIVAPINVRELIEQWTALLAIDAEPDANVRLGSGGLITRRAFVDTHGRVLLEEYLIDGMEHGIPISAACGAPAEFSIDVDFCGTEHVGQFWGLLPGPP
jgi:poly(3-hydroxybutyrate) depolymerase